MMSIPVVIVDDEEFDRYIARRAITRSGADCRVIEFDAGDTFAKVFGDDVAFHEKIGDVPPPVLVLLDINMPRMNGFEVLEQIKHQFASHQREPACFIVMMYSSSNHAKDRSSAMQYDFVRDYIVKPIDEMSFKALMMTYYPQASAASPQMGQG